jgi:hypothetical protein
MKLETKITFNQYLKLMYALTYRKPMTIFLSIIGLIMFIGSVLYFFGFNVPVDKPPYIQLILGFSFSAFLPFSVYKSARKNYSTNKRLQENITYDFTEEKVTIKGETFNSEWTWEKTYKIEELRNWILIYQNNIVANIIPKANFENNLDEFKRWINRKTFIKTNFSTFKKARNYIYILLPLSPFLLLGSVFVFSRAKPELIQVPKNYQGEILILFDQPNGDSMVYSNGKRVYKIPKNGILFTQFPWNPGSINRKFCYSTSDNSTNIDEVKRNYLFKPGDADSNQISIIDKGPYYYRDTVGNRYLFRAERFVISTRSKLNIYTGYTKLDSIIEADY